MQGKKLIGDRIANALTFAGVTKERVAIILGSDCGCADRQEYLNDLDRWARYTATATKQKALNYLERILCNQALEQLPIPEHNTSLRTDQDQQEQLS